MRHGLRALAITLALTGCYPDFGGYQIEPVGGRDGGDPPVRDGGGSDAGGGGPSGCAPAVTCASGCAMPWLLASVEDLGGECGGQVWRFSLFGDRGEFCVCEPLTGQGEMPALPFAVGFSPPETVVVAAEAASVMAIDGRNDNVIWEEPFSPQPVDVFAIQDPMGNPLIGVAGRMRGGDIRSIALFDAAAGGAPIQRSLNTGDLPLGLNVASVSQSSFDRTWFRAMRSDMFAAADVDPWNDVRVEPPYTRARTGFFVRTLHSSYDGRFHRAVWTGEQGEVDGVFRHARADDSGDNSVPLPERCRENPDGSDYDVDCTYLHAVADPALNTSSIAICEHSGSARRIVRLGSFGDCRTMADDGDLPARVRVSRLGLAQASFWP